MLRGDHLERIRWTSDGGGLVGPRYRVLRRSQPLGYIITVYGDVDKIGGTRSLTSRFFKEQLEVSSPLTTLQTKLQSRVCE